MFKDSQQEGRSPARIAPRTAGLAVACGLAFVGAMVGAMVDATALRRAEVVAARPARPARPERHTRPTPPTLAQVRTLGPQAWHLGIRSQARGATAAWSVPGVVAAARCQSVATHLGVLATVEVQRRMPAATQAALAGVAARIVAAQRFVVDLCVAEKWSDKEKACVLAAQSADEARACS